MVSRPRLRGAFFSSNGKRAPQAGAANHLRAIQRKASSGVMCDSEQLPLSEREAVPVVDEDPAAAAGPDAAAGPEDQQPVVAEQAPRERDRHARLEADEHRLVPVAA